MENKGWLTIVVSTFFLIQAMVHLIKPRVLENYAIRRGYLSAGQVVRLSGLLLILGTALLWVEKFRFYGALALALFTFAAAWSIHKFWDEKSGEMQVVELLNFSKNVLIGALLIYLAMEWQ